jgi:hypothetical protein
MGAHAVSFCLAELLNVERTSSCINTYIRHGALPPKLEKQFGLSILYYPVASSSEMKLLANLQLQKESD